MNTSQEEKNKKIKSFIYLDEYKMYSISSKIFEGLTEYVTNFSQKDNRDLEQQEGPTGSGRVLANIITQQSLREEKKFFHDHSYTLFEEELFNSGRVLKINGDNIGISIASIEDYDFIKVTGRILFNDIHIINDMIEKFPQLSNALAYMTHMEQINQEKQNKLDLQKIIDNTKDRNEKARLKENLRRLPSIEIDSLVSNLGWNIDKNFLEYLGFILNHGYKDQFEVKIYLPTEAKIILFSSLLKREYLREEEQILVNKYSRYSEKEFSILGMITQSKNNHGNLPVEQIDNPQDIKQILAQVIMALSEIEKQFTGKRMNEIIIDPIAIYREF